MIKSKIFQNVKTNYKSHLYLKSLSLKTDFSNYSKHFKIWHPQYFDVVRRTQYNKENRDFRKLTFNTQDPLHFDYHLEKVNGGIPRLLENLKNSTNESTFYSIYRIIFLIYHMAYSENYDSEFFDELDNRINFNLVNHDIISFRHIYGALFAYYKFNRGKLENIMNFESLLESEPKDLHTEMTIVLFDLVHETKVVDPERLNILYRSFYKVNLIQNWEKEINFKPRNICELHRLFMKHNLTDPDLYKPLIKSTIGIQRVTDIRKYDQMLRGLNWMNTNPKSPYFKELDKEIEGFKDRVRNNENKLWRYNPDTASFRTYSELLEKRNEFNEDYIYVHWAGYQKKADVKVIEEKKNLTDAEIEAIIRNRLQAKDSFYKIKGDLLEQGITDKKLDDMFVEIVKEIQSKQLETLRKQGEFAPEMTEEQILEKRKKAIAAKATAKPAAGAAAPGKKDDKKKK